MTWRIYKGKDGWRWQCKASNGRIVQSSSEAYSSRSKAARNARTAGYVPKLTAAQKQRIRYGVAAGRTLLGLARELSLTVWEIERGMVR